MQPPPKLIDSGHRTTVLIVGGGDPPTAIDRSRWPAANLVIVADAGTDHALAANLSIDLVVGDLDSVSATGLAEATASGATVERHDREKDESDLELALARGLEREPDRIVITGVSGGRLDHFMANLLLAASIATSEVVVDIVSGGDQIFVVRGARSFTSEPGQVITLLPAHGAASGVTTTGLRYPLDSERLEAGSTRGLSNIAIASTVTINVEAGVLLAIVPGGDHV